jgi:hypothetical protein
MNRNLTQIFLILGGIAMSMLAGIKLLRGGWMDMLWFMACLVPFVLALVLGMRKWWPVLAIVIPAVPLPAAGQVLLDKITPELAFYTLIIAFFLGHICIAREGVSPRYRFVRPLIIVALFVTIRLIVDPPGSGRVGGTGGLRVALDYLVASWIAFPIIWVASKGEVSERVIFKSLLLIGLITFGIQVAKNPYNILYELYHRRSWLLWPFVLAAIANGMQKRPARKLIFHGLSLAILGFALINPHRKSIFMAGSVLMVIAWIYRLEKRQLAVLGVAGVIGLAVLVSLGRVPQIMRRSLSTILPGMIVTKETQGYMGWQDDYRYFNLQFALNDIVRNPITGKGFSWSTADAVRLLQNRKLGGMSTTSALSVQVGNTHFGFVDLMVRTGALVPWFYAYSLLGVLIILIWVARSMPPGSPKALAAGLSGFYINNLFQWLFNGGAQQMLVMSVAMGLTAGLLIKWGKLPYRDQKVSLLATKPAVEPTYAESYALSARES